jgi:DNA-binding NtrC family response regulator
LFTHTTEQQTEKLPGNPATKERAKQEITVLLVEADHGVRHLVRHMLLKAGHAVYETSDPREAAGICETTQVDLLLTDLVMPAMNGAELAVNLMKTHGELRVLYMSGCIDDSILPSRCLEPSVHFIRKPFSAASLSKQIEAMFDVVPEQDQLLHALS